MEKDIRETKFGWVDFSNFPKKNGNLNWQDSVGSIVPFKYKDILAEAIIKYVESKDVVYIDIPGCVTNHKMNIRYIKYGKFGKCVGRSKLNFQYNVGDIVNGIEIIDRYVKNYRQYYICKCLLDGYEWNIRVDNLNSGHGCPICNSSIGEKQVKNYLIEHNIKFIPQHTFDGCRHIKLLYFDFYLPDLHICIEYDGKQHFEPIEWFGGEDDLQQTKIRDKIKDSYCNNNHIKMLRIKYNQNVETVLDEFFNTIK